VKGKDEKTKYEAKTNLQEVDEEEQKRQRALMWKHFSVQFAADLAGMKEPWHSATVPVGRTTAPEIPAGYRGWWIEIHAENPGGAPGKTTWDTPRIFRRDFNSPVTALSHSPGIAGNCRGEGWGVKRIGCDLIPTGGC
jgi:hypothetical protein